MRASSFPTCRQQRGLTKAEDGPQAAPTTSGKHVCKSTRAKSYRPMAQPPTLSPHPKADGCCALEKPRLKIQIHQRTPPGGTGLHPHCPGRVTHATFFSQTHHVPEENTMNRATLHELWGFTISLSIHAGCYPSHPNKLLWYRKRWLFFKLLPKNLPYWFHDWVAHATCLTEQVTLKKAPNIHEAGPSIAGLGSSRNGVPGLLAKPSALGG